MRNRHILNRRNKWHTASQKKLKHEIKLLKKENRQLKAEICKYRRSGLSNYLDLAATQFLASKKPPTFEEMKKAVLGNKYVEPEILKAIEANR